MRNLPALSAIAAFAAGCAAPPIALAPPQVQFVSVPDGNWELATSSFIDTGRMPGVPRAKLAFKDGRMSAFSGCNTATASVHGASGRLDAGALVTTRRACPEPLGTFESRFFKLLGAQPFYRIEGDVLTLAGSDHSARFRRTP